VVAGLEREIPRPVASGRLVDGPALGDARVAAAVRVFGDAAAHAGVELLRQQGAQRAQAGDQALVRHRVAGGDLGLQLHAALVGGGQHRGRMLALQIRILDDLGDHHQAILVIHVFADLADHLADEQMERRLPRDAVRRVGGERRGRLAGAERGGGQQAVAAGVFGAIGNAGGLGIHRKNVLLFSSWRMCPSPNTLVYYLDYVNSLSLFYKKKKAPIAGSCPLGYSTKAVRARSVRVRTVCGVLEICLGLVGEIGAGAPAAITMAGRPGFGTR